MLPIIFLDLQTVYYILAGFFCKIIARITLFLLKHKQCDINRLAKQQKLKVFESLLQEMESFMSHVNDPISHCNDCIRKIQAGLEINSSDLELEKLDFMIKTRKRFEDTKIKMEEGMEDLKQKIYILKHNDLFFVPYQLNPFFLYFFKFQNYKRMYKSKQRILSRFNTCFQ
jgi:hypothetical protein